MDKVEKSFQDKAKGILRAEIKRRNLGYGELSNRCKDAIRLAGERGVSAEELAVLPSTRHRKPEGSPPR